MSPMRTVPPRAAVPWRHRARAAMSERLALKGTALFLAVVLWVITSTREETEELVPVRFAPVMDQSLVLRDRPPAVMVLVRGLGREILKLRQTPPVIRRTIAGELPDTLPLELRPSDVDLPPGVDARVLDVRPRTILLAFRPIVSRYVPVRSALLVHPDSLGRIPVGFYFHPESVRVAGRRRGVQRVAVVRTVPDTLPARLGVTHTVALDTIGLRELGVQVRPTTVRVRVARLATADSADGETRIGRLRRRP